VSGVFDTGAKIITGNVAHDAADASAPVKIGGRARTGVAGSVSDNDRVDAWLDARGRLIVQIENDSGNIANLLGNNLRVLLYGGATGATQVQVNTSGQIATTSAGTMVDDAAFTPATSPVTPVGGTYRSSVDELDADDVGAIALTKRRAIVGGSDCVVETLLNATPAEDADAYLTPTRTVGGRAMGIYVYNQTGQTVQLRIYMMTAPSAAVIFDDTLANGMIWVFGPAAGGTGASAYYIPIPALGFPVFPTFAIRYTISGVSSGALRVDVSQLS